MSLGEGVARAGFQVALEGTSARVILETDGGFDFPRGVSGRVVRLSGVVFGEAGA
jgi:hypothetical protein